jgi:hypothetical protein
MQAAGRLLELCGSPHLSADASPSAPLELVQTQKPRADQESAACGCTNSETNAVLPFFFETSRFPRTLSPHNRTFCAIRPYCFVCVMKIATAAFSILDFPFLPSRKQALPTHATARQAWCSLEVSLLGLKKTGRRPPCALIQRARLRRTTGHQET